MATLRFTVVSLSSGKHFPLPARPCSRVSSTVTCGKKSTRTVHTGKEQQSRYQHTVSEVVALQPFENAFAGKSTKELLRGLVVLKASSIDMLVNYSDKLLTTTSRILWQPAFKRLMDLTFYGQFVAGDNNIDVLATAAKLREADISSMLFIPIETNTSHGAMREDKYDENFELVHEYIRTTATLEDYGFTQVKVTALCDPGLLEDMNAYLQNFEQEHLESRGWEIEKMGKLIEAKLFDRINIEELSEASNEKLRKAFIRLNALAEQCRSCNIRMMIDAEQTYIQAAIGYVVLVLQHVYNRTTPVIYNTYQCYRKDTLTRVQADHVLGNSLGFKIAGKLVRGAYMNEERRLAVVKGYDNPICDGKDRTTDSYHSTVDFLLPLVKKRDVGLMVASHNEGTVNYVKSRSSELAIDKHNNLLVYAQIFGMCDHVSYSLGAEGYKVFKSVPYGSIDSTLLYLARRAQENRSVGERTKYERELMMNELMKRVKRRLPISS